MRFMLLLMAAFLMAGQPHAAPVVITDVETSGADDSGGTSATSALAQEVPPILQPSSPVLADMYGTDGAAPVQVPDHTALSMQLDGYSRQVNSWATAVQTDVDKLQDQVVSLEEEVAGLKARVAALESQQPGGEPPDLEARFAAIEARLTELERSKGTVTAPFKVVDASGFPLVLVDENAATFTIPSGGSTNIQLKAGTTPQIYLGNQAGGVSIEGGETTRLNFANGDTSVFEIKEDASNGVTIVGKTAEGVFELGSGPSLVGLMIKKGDQPAAGLGTFDGRGIALRVFAASGMVVGAMGENPGTPGTGIAYVGNGSQNAAALAVAEDGSGLVHAFASDGTVGSGLIGGDRMVAAYNAAGSAVVTIGKSENSEGGNVTARDPAGDGVFRAGYNSEVTGGDACVYRAKRQNVFCLGIGAPGMGIGTF